ncbi:AfsR/SARP family transcriptional regulator [Streptomyces coerulescens]|uniref:BTAD domain-containing putative transcriptional regulator n=1 Tax=Streptomyces coerulescens TaxID=29304 RepID=A0ABW0CYB7_STRCD
MSDVLEVRFRVLGPLEVIGGEDRELTPSAPKLRQLVALLLVSGNRIVGTHEMMDELWGSRPPVSALATLQSYVYKIRKNVFEVLEGTGISLHTKPNGYRLDIPDGALDVHRFEKLSDLGRKAFDGGDVKTAAELLADALAFWRGAPLANVEPGDQLGVQITRFQERRMRAVELRLEAELQLGRHRELVSELRMLCSTHPLDEGMHAKLMIALYRSGRRYDALETYQTFRRSMIDELGLEPSPMLARLHTAVLAAEPELHPEDESELELALLPVRTGPEGIDAVSGRTAVGDGDDEQLGESAGSRIAAAVGLPSGGSVQQVRNVPHPAQLRPDIADFTGRAKMLARLESRLTERHEQYAPLSVLWITGMPGVGKSALATRLAHRVRDWFPDGQLYVDLRGDSDDPVHPRTVLHRFLAALGEHRSALPDDIDEASELFRSRCASRSLLFLLDGASGTAQVKPLLPGSGDCAVVVTSLAHGLAGSELVLLNPLSDDEALRFLTSIVGPQRAAEDPCAVERIVKLCGGLPLALRAVGTRLGRLQGWPLGQFAERLADPRRRFDESSLPGLDLRASYDAGFRKLDERDRLAMQLFAMRSSGPFTAEDAAEQLGCDRVSAEGVLARLAERHLLRGTGSKDGPLGYSVHELVRVYALQWLAGN